MDRLVHLQRLRGQHRHQRAGGTVAIGDEVGQAGDAHPFHRQPAQRLATGHGDVRSHQQQSLRLPGQRPAVQRFRLVETKQGVLAQRCDRAWLAQPVQIGRAGHQPQPAAAQRPCMQGGIGQRPDPDRQVAARPGSALDNPPPVARSRAARTALPRPRAGARPGARGAPPSVPPPTPPHR
ncbi:hypothetical protein G6F57_020676 [Rhizopus arrhizus]|nr:hypothetical protein G6F57_020676 [Rhizopus arrhizus]